MYFSIAVTVVQCTQEPHLDLREVGGAGVNGRRRRRQVVVLRLCTLRRAPLAAPFEELARELACVFALAEVHLDVVLHLVGRLNVAQEVDERGDCIRKRGDR